MRPERTKTYDSFWNLQIDIHELKRYINTTALAVPNRVISSDGHCVSDNVDPLPSSAKHRTLKPVEFKGKIAYQAYQALCFSLYLHRTLYHEP